MRAGSCGLQQQQAALRPEVAAMVKQAVILAKRRGHAQVTPIHVANSLLSEPNGLLRAACLKSRSHPLLCKALELCFNVALNRLPASSSSSMLSPRHPSTSNALVAVFKRAQAHQRRGSIETQQQQTVLAAKIELEQLVISILDDPSVSRVMKEAGFSSTQVKSIVEKDASSLEMCPQNSLNRSIGPNDKPKELNRSLTAESLRSTGEPVNNVRREDVNVMIESLLAKGKRTKSLVIVGECISNMENIVRAFMGRVDIGEVPEELKEVKFVSIPPLYSFCNLQREEVEKKMTELTCLVTSLLSKGVVLYLGDLKWISDYSTTVNKSEQERGCYCSVEHVIMELGRMVWGINGEIGKFWLMGISTFNTYMRCRSGCNNSLETVWGLHPVIIPANSLGLSLISDKSDEVQLEYRRPEINESTDQMWLLSKNGSAAHIKPSCIKGYAEKFEAEADQNRKASSGDATNEPEPTLSILPAWLKDESRRNIDDHRQNYDTYCSLAHKKQPTTPSSSSSSPSFEETLRWPCNDISTKPNEDDIRHVFSCNRSSSPHNSASSSDVMDFEYTQKLEEFNTENLNHLCNALEKKVPSHKNVIPEIIGTILQCRSGLLTREEQETKGDAKEDTWLLFIGCDVQAKENISRELAKLLFGSDSNFVSIGPNNSFDNSSTEVISLNESQNRDDHRSPFDFTDRFFHAVKANPHRVFFVEDLKDVDYTSRMGIKRAIKSGRICNANVDQRVSLRDAIVVLSCERLQSKSRRCLSDPRYSNDDTNVIKSNASFDLNVLASDDDDHENYCYDDDVDMGILESVDRLVVFEIKDL